MLHYCIILLRENGSLPDSCLGDTFVRGCVSMSGGRGREREKVDWWVQMLGFRVWGISFGVWRLGFWRLGFRVQALGFGVGGLGFWGLGLGADNLIVFGSLGPLRCSSFNPKP